MVDTGIVVTGAKETAEAYQGRPVEKASEKPFTQLLNKIERAAKIATPVDTGRLGASITHELTGPMSGVVGTNVLYAPFVEFGTSKMEARHVEGSAVRVLGVGMFAYTVDQLAGDLADYEVNVVNNMKKELEE